MSSIPQLLRSNVSFNPSPGPQSIQVTLFSCVAFSGRSEVDSSSPSPVVPGTIPACCSAHRYESPLLAGDFHDDQLLEMLTASFA